MKQQKISFKKIRQKKLTLRCFAHCQSRPKQSASAAHRCARRQLLDVLVANLQIDTSGVETN